MKKRIPVSFGEQIRALREEKQLPLKKVSGDLKIDTSLLAKFERNERQPSKESIESLAAYYKADKKLLVTQSLSDRIAYEMLDEEEGLKILRIAEKKFMYLKARKR